MGFGATGHGGSPPLMPQITGPALGPLRNIFKLLVCCLGSLVTLKGAVFLKMGLNSFLETSGFQE